VTASAHAIATHHPFQTNRSFAIDTLAMAKPQTSPINETGINELDVALLDVFAQAEAMLRCGREIQRNLIRLRDGNGPTGRAERSSILKKIDQAAAELHDESKTIVPLTRDIRQAARRLE
jgi:hypothetical protein